LARSFDTETNASLQATGFVVDAKRGLILTNRHVVTTGPVTAKGIFLDREEVQLYPVYRDPVHDFGFYRYDPLQLRFITPEEIALDPSGARIGTDIRVVGNDAGEQLSFLSGTLARLDRQAPVYGAGKYNDFNTFYYQAASSTSGGSSGSPVIDLRGRAVALNAGAATGAASSFYLPLDRVVRALRYIQRNEKVPRGTLHAVFNYTPFDELRELGLPTETEAEMRARFPRQVGMLVVSQDLPVVGVYVANAGYIFGAGGIPRGAVITHFAGKDIGNLDHLANALAALADGDRAAVRYLTVEDTSAPQQRSVIIDRKWYPTRRCKRDDALGYWPCQSLVSAQAPKPMRAPISGSARIIANPRARHVAASLVAVDFDVPYPVSGVTGRSFHGTGLIVDTARGLVVVDRNTVPVAEGDVHITFSGALEVPGKVVFVHPIHNLAAVAYDPRLIGPTPVRSARLVDRSLTPGEPVRVMGLGQDQQHVMVATTSIAAIEAIQLPVPRTPTFRDTNIDVVTLVNGPNDFDGVLVDKSDGVLALWASFALDNGHEVTERNIGLPIAIVVDMMNVIRHGGTLRSLEAELSAVSMSSARKLGLSQRYLQQLQRHMPAGGQVLSVARLVAGTPAAQLLQTGDLILSIDGRPVTRFREVERCAQKPRVHLAVWRNGAVLPLELDTVVLTGRDIDRILLWAGATLQASHRALAAQRGIAPHGVFVAYYLYGSPASRSGLWAPRRIVEVDGNLTPDLDAFLAAVAGKPDRTAVLLKTLTWNDAVEIITLKIDQHYWPTYDLRRTEGGWERTER
jgi:S1-C subfamily serine protease